MSGIATFTNDFLTAAPHHRRLRKALAPVFISHPPGSVPPAFTHALPGLALGLVPDLITRICPAHNRQRAGAAWQAVPTHCAQFGGH